MARVVFIPAVSLLLVPTIYRTSRFRKVYKRALRCKAGPTRQTTTEESAAMWRPAVGRDGSFPLNLPSVWEHHYRLNATCFCKKAWQVEDLISPLLAGWCPGKLSVAEADVWIFSSSKKSLVENHSYYICSAAPPQKYIYNNAQNFLYFLLNQWVEHVNTHITYNDKSRFETFEAACR